MEEENERAAGQTPAGEKGGESTWFVKLPAITRKLGMLYQCLAEIEWLLH